MFSWSRMFIEGLTGSRPSQYAMVQYAVPMRCEDWTLPARATGSFAAAWGSTLAIRDVLFEPGDFVAMDSDDVVIVTTDMAKRAALSGA